MKIAKSVQLPYETVKGTLAQRYHKVVETNEKVFNQIMECPDDLSFSRLQALLQDTFVSRTGRPVDVEVSTLSLPGIGGVHEFKKCNGDIVGFNIKVPNNEGALPLSNLAHFMHEVTHTGQLLYEPKIMFRHARLDNLPEASKNRIEKFYDNVLYHQEMSDYFNEFFAQIRLKFAMRKLEDSQKLNVLMEMRNFLRMEYYACLEAEKYELKLLNSGVDVVKAATVDEFFFPEKFEFLNEEIYKLIKKMRKN